MDKFKILIIDDVAGQRDLVQAALVKGATITQEIRRKLSSGLFDIKRCTIAGEAIKILEEFQPDLALIDISFNELDTLYIIKQGYDPAKEKSSSRGLDVLVALQEKCPTTFPILFTGKAGQTDIYQILKEKGIYGAENFIPLLSKEVGLLELTEAVNRALTLLVEQYTTKIDIFALRKVYQTMDKNDEEYCLNIPIKVDQKTFLSRHFFTYLAEAQADEKLAYVGISSALKNLLEAQLEAPIHQLPPLNGHWRYSWVQQAIEQFRVHQHYEASNNTINRHAANFILTAIRALNSGVTFNPPHHPYRNFNIGEQSQTYGVPGWTEIFHNALMMRRVLLGFSRLAESQARIFYANATFPEPTKLILSTMLSLCVISESTESDNIRHIISRVLGLSKKKRVERVNENFILKEEGAFLENFIPPIITRMNPQAYFNDADRYELF